MIDWLIIYKNKIGKASKSEKRSYSKWQKTFRHHQYADEVTKYFESDGAFTPLTQKELKEKYKLVLLSSDSEEKRREEKRRGVRTLFISTISVAALLTISFILYNNDSQKIGNMPNSISESKIDSPTLILNSGENIKLDGSEKTDLLIEKVEKEKISYINKERKEVTVDKLVYNTLVIPSKHTFTIILDDSSEVFLNANSKLRYPVRFVGDKREVFLEGEAYFKVSKNAKPFVVSTSALSVKVYGTQFNVNTNNTHFVEAVLVSGEIGVTTNALRSVEIKMTPNQRFIYNTEKKESQIKYVDPNRYIAWTNGFFQYDDERLDIVLGRIAKWYGISFDYSNKDIRAIPISIKLKTTTKLENILSAIEEVSGAIIIKTGVNSYAIEKM